MPKGINVKHGCYGSSTYRSWAAMLTRCTNPKHPQYERYSKLGVDPKWLDFSGFLEDMGYRPEGHTLDRKDNELGYTKSNCQWSDRKAQSVNRSNVVLYTMDGVSMTLSDWAKHLGVPRSTLYRKVSAGVPLQLFR